MNTVHKNEFDKLRIKAHEFLADIPMHSLYRLDLPGGRIGMNVLDIKETIGFNTDNLEPGGITRALFWLRGLIGRALGWDEAEELAESVSFLKKLTPEERSQSLILPGTKEGIGQVLYCFGNELLAEIVNRTVHCFWVMATKPTADGYALYMAVFVKKLNWFTPIYMAFVTPMLTWVIYPALNKSIMRNWKNAERSAHGKAAHA
jgi:hypothetical protein